MARKKTKKVIPILIAILLIGVLGVSVFFFMGGTPDATINEGASMEPVIMDASGNVIGTLGEGTGTAQTIVAKETGTGFTTFNNVDTFLGFVTRLDNAAGDSEVTITDVVGSNPCNAANTNPGCAGIANIMGGALNTKWDSELPLTLPKGQVSNEVNSDPLNLGSIELGLLDFRMDVVGTFLDAQGVDQPLVDKFGQVTLKIFKEQCADGTTADPDSSDGDSASFCSSVQTRKYCRVDSSGITSLTDRASLCGCPTGTVPVGEVCTTIEDCTTAWGASTCNPSGGILYCNADGSITNECSICGVGQCPTNANGDSATGCEADTNSICSYPEAAGSGFGVTITEPDIPTQQECGDEVKNGAEDCDANDFGGETCVSQGFSSGTLSCTAGCAYDTSSCIADNVEFRTSSTAYPNSISADNWIAFAELGCGLDLTGYRYDARSGGTGTARTCASEFGTATYTDLNNVGGSDLITLAHLDVSYVDTKGTGIISLHEQGRYIYLCENNADNTRYGYYRYDSSETNNAETSKSPVTPANEIAC